MRRRLSDAMPLRNGSLGSRTLSPTGRCDTGADDCRVVPARCVLCLSTVFCWCCWADGRWGYVGVEAASKAIASSVVGEKRDGLVIMNRGRQLGLTRMSKPDTSIVKTSPKPQTQCNPQRFSNFTPASVTPRKTPGPRRLAPTHGTGATALRLIGAQQQNQPARLSVRFFTG